MKMTMTMTTTTTMKKSHCRCRRHRHRHLHQTHPSSLSLWFVVMCCGLKSPSRNSEDLNQQEFLLLHLHPGKFHHWTTTMKKSQLGDEIQPPRMVPSGRLGRQKEFQAGGHIPGTNWKSLSGTEGSWISRPVHLFKKKTGEPIGNVCQPKTSEGLQMFCSLNRH